MAGVSSFGIQPWSLSANQHSPPLLEPSQTYGMKEPTRIVLSPRVRQSQTRPVPVGVKP